LIAQSPARGGSGTKARKSLSAAFEEEISNSSKLEIQPGQGGVLPLQASEVSVTLVSASSVQDQNGSNMVVNSNTLNNNNNSSNNSVSVAPASSTSSNSSMSSPTNITPGVAHACLICRPNSHPFNDRTLTLDQPVKVGRSVARARATQTNAIFDCKVLSRNHALLWYEAGKFYLQDTKSSNGTFVNNQRLSKGSEESAPREVCSGDILQFGVDVMENSRKVTHGCIIATLKLYLPDGKEAKASPTIVNSTSNPALLSLSLPTQDLYQLNQYIQEALAREQLLETKLAVLQRLVGQTESASNESWKSLIDEDRLLTRVEILESQLSTYGKSMNEDKLREETKRLMEEKEEYQEQAKDTLKRIVNEKLDAVKKLQDVEKTLSTTEDEFATLRELYDKNNDENRTLAAEINRLSSDLEIAMEANARIPKTEPANEGAEMAELAPEDDKPEILESAVDISASGLLPIAATSCPATLESESETIDKMLSQQTTINLEDNAEISEMSSDLNDSLNTSTTTLDMSSLSETEMDEIDESAVATAAGSGIPTGSVLATAAGSAIVAATAEQENDEQRVKLMTDRLVDMEAKLQESRTNYETVKESNSAINMELTVAQEQLCESLKLLDEKCRLLEEIEVQKIKSFAAENKMEQKQTPPAAAAAETSENNEIDDKIAKLNDEKEQICSENERLRTDLNSHLQTIEDLEQQVKSMTDSQLMAASSTSTLVGSTIQTTSAGNDSTGSNTNSVNSQLEKAESKISELLKVKEKFAEVSAENSTLAMNLSEMQQEMNLMTRTATACALIPLAVVLLAMFAYYFPFFGFFGGNGSGSSGTGSGGSSTQ